MHNQTSNQTGEGNALRRFSADINLDDPYEIAEFLDKHNTTKGRRLANALDFHGKFAVRAANALSNYAWNKHTAIVCRTKGNIVEGQRYEAICDKIYTQDIDPLIECW